MRPNPSFFVLGRRIRRPRDPWAVNDEVRSMIELGVIERSESPYCSPVIIVKKKDNTNRFCIDFRVLNKITVFDAEPMPSMEQIFAKLAGYKFISKLDLSKGY